MNTIFGGAACTAKPASATTKANAMRNMMILRLLFRIEPPQVQRRAFFIESDEQFRIGNQEQMIGIIQSHRFRSIQARFER